jgi:GTP-binding protein LepA
MKNIRNFALIAHIDHGKSTLADRIIEACGQKVELPQILDSLELEREHGITIKLKAIRLGYQLSAESYQLNLIDTPGHVDFSYEVSRSLAACEGAILVVDAAQGVQAQTLANYNLAVLASLKLIAAVNKIDLPEADVERTKNELLELGFGIDEIFPISAKSGEGVDKLLEGVVEKIPAPLEDREERSLIFDSSLDPFKGVVATVRIFGGAVSKGNEIEFLATKASAKVLQIGFLAPKPTFIDKLSAGEIGFLVTNLKDLSSCQVGDTVTKINQDVYSLPGYKKAKPVVFLSFYPTAEGEFEKLKKAFETLALNDSSLDYKSENSPSLGFGIRCGFQGLLHAQITQERLEREYDLDLLLVAPSVSYLLGGKFVTNPADFDPTAREIKEPYISAIVFTPKEYFGSISKLIYSHRGGEVKVETFGNQLKIESLIPLAEILTGFYDELKSVSSGFASFDFELADYYDADLVKVDVLVNHKIVEGLSQIVPRVKSQTFASKFAEKLKEVIPRQQFAVPIQVAIGGKILARQTVPAFRKDVTEPLYGGDVTRKMKLLEKQKRGKKRMKRFGNVDIPQEAFMAVLKI